MSSDGEEDNPDDLGDGGDVSGYVGDEQDETLPDIENPGVPLLPMGPAGADGPPVKKRRKGPRQPTVWIKQDLPPQQMPTSTVKPKGMQDCKLDVQFFLKMFGVNNIDLLTHQTNLVRVKKSIERNRPIPAFSEKEIRQVIGILLYMSVVKLPSIQLYWRKTMRNSMVANVMFRDRFQLIFNCLHLSDNTMQPSATSPLFDRLYKVRKFLDNIAANFKNNADIEEITSVDEQMIPFKGQIGIKVYMKDKPAPWGIKVGYISPIYSVEFFTVFIQIQLLDIDPSV